MLLSMRLAEHVYESVRTGKTSGSNSIHDETPSTKGYMVGGNSWSMVIPSGCITETLTHSYVLHHLGMLYKPEMFLGWWEHKGKIYLDVSERFLVKDTAIVRAKWLNEIAIWDIENRIDIHI